MFDNECKIKKLAVAVTITVCFTALPSSASAPLDKAAITIDVNSKRFKQDVTIAGDSVQWKVKPDSIVATESQTMVADNLNPDLEKCGESKFPYQSKMDGTLSLLLNLKKKDQVPHKMKNILMKDTVSVSIRFTHELNADQIKSIEALGLEFVRLPGGEIAHSGIIYGANVVWDKIEDLIELDSVVRIESTWQPGIQSPDSYIRD